MSGDLAHSNEVDAHVVGDICGYVTDTPPRSFFLLAGAGSGKTRTLVNVLRRLTGIAPESEAERQFATRLRFRRQCVRVITYTKVAAREITHRLGSNPLVKVSTIHAFAWDLIQGFDEDIREAMIARVEEKRRRAQDEANAKKKGPSKKDLNELQELVDQRERLESTAKFTYTPDKNTYGDGALQHEDVLQVLATLVTNRPALQRILADQHPVLLIDESQDTMRGVIDALITVEGTPSSGLVLGLLGDHRQKVYFGGHDDLTTRIPPGWETPRLRMNHRSEARIVTLINRIWAAKVDGRARQPTGGAQYARTDKMGGTIRLFIGVDAADKPAQERAWAEAMACFTGDELWRDHHEGYQRLALEHMMVARRAGFSKVWEALNLADPNGCRERGEADDGSDAGPSIIRVLMHEVPALTSCFSTDGEVNGFRAVETLRRFGRLDVLACPPGEQRAVLHRLDLGVTALAEAARRPGVTIREVATAVSEHRLFDLHPRLRTMLDGGMDSTSRGEESEVNEEKKKPKQDAAWQAFLDAPWAELAQYRAYLSDQLPYGTHQGVKGAEYPRVMVVIDDEAAGGTLFSYGKVLGETTRTDTDRENEAAGKETSVDRTLRLLYVTCSRPQKSLAVVCWAKNAAAVEAQVKAYGWFEEDEIIRQ